MSGKQISLALLHRKTGKHGQPFWQSSPLPSKGIQNGLHAIWLPYGHRFFMHPEKPAGLGTPTHRLSIAIPDRNGKHAYTHLAHLYPVPGENLTVIKMQEIPVRTPETEQIAFPAETGFSAERIPERESSYALWTRLP